MKKEYLKGLAVLILISILSFLSYGKALDYNFYRDDWPLLWLAQHTRREYLTWILSIRHPGEVINTYFGVLFLGVNRFYWQLLGLFTKILTSLAVGLAFYGLTNNKKSGYVSSLLYASTFLGLEAFTWLSARLSAYLLFFSCILIYFYSKSFFKNSFKLYFASLLILFFITFLEPGKALFVPFLLVLWEICERFVGKNLFKKIFFVRIFFLVTVAIAGLTTTNFGKSILEGESSDNYLQILLKYKSLIKNYFYSIGNLIQIYFRGLNEWAALPKNVDEQTINMGIFLILFFTSYLIWCLLKRKKNAPILVFSLAWVTVLYFPSWISEMPLAVGVSHRYLTLSSAGVIWILTIILVKRNKYLFHLLLLILITTNTYFSRQVVKGEFSIRGFSVTQPMYEALEKDVPKDDNQKLFLVGGKHFLRGYAFDWATNGSVPFSFIRGIREENKLPVFGVGYDLAGKLTCENDVPRPSVNEWVIQKKPVKIKDIYGWYVNDNGKLIENSDFERIRVAHYSKCFRKDIGKEIIRGVNLDSYVNLTDLYTPDKKALSFSWKIDIDVVKKAKINIELFDRKMNLLKSIEIIKEIEPDVGILITPVYLFNNEDDVKRASFSINVCGNLCSSFSDKSAKYILDIQGI